jgi:chromosome partitioning protein
MKTIAFHLQKGGVGKTTLSGTMAAEAAKKGKTLLIDCDPQGNASSWFLNEFVYEVSDILNGHRFVNEVICNVSENFDILPTFGLDGGLKLYGEAKLIHELFVFCDLIEEVEKLGYQYVVVDMSPGMGFLEKAVLIACDEVVTPMTPEFFSLDGITIFTNELFKLKKSMRKAPEHSVVILNAFDGRIKQHNEIYKSAMTLEHDVIMVPVDPVFRKSQAAKKIPQNYGGMKPVTVEAIKTIGSTLWQ